jgi:hypothetical protein
MLKPHEAAAYCGRSMARFTAECPVAAVAFPNGDRLFDLRDLDAWLDGLKEPQDVSDLIARLK